MTHDTWVSRRTAIGAAASALLLGGSSPLAAYQKQPLLHPWSITTFRADVTPPTGHPCMGGGISPVKSVADPLEAIGFVLQGGMLAKPVVLLALDWCEIRNEAYDRWREVIAKAANTDVQHVLVMALHQHDAPIVDLRAQRLLEQSRTTASVCHLKWHELMVQRVARALKASLQAPPRTITHYGVGQAKVEKVSSNRRFPRPDGTISYTRTSASRDPQAHEAPEGTIDPWLKTLSFWDGDTPVLALSHYAVHPMSHYGRGEVSADFVGLARRARQKALPEVTQIYVSGCSGNLTAGKYNDGSPEQRPALASRLEKAMAAAWEGTKRIPLQQAAFRVAPLRFEPRDDEGFRKDDLTRRLKEDPKPFDKCLAALGLSWRDRLESGQAVDLPALDLGQAVFTLLPGETYVEYQLLAQKLRPDAFVIAAGYGESGTGYIPTALQVSEHDGNLADWCWVAPSAERILTKGLEEVLKPGR